jgi:hypothetical protein
MSDRLKAVLDTALKMVNFVKARPLNSHVFSVLCNDMGSDHVTLLQHRLTDDLCMCGSHREAWRSRCDGDLLVTLSVINLEATFSQHGYQSSLR